MQIEFDKSEIEFMIKQYYNEKMKSISGKNLEVSDTSHWTDYIEPSGYTLILKGDD